MLDILNKHHFAERAMLAASSDTIWWPCINGQIKSKYFNCTTCMQLKRNNDPGTPISQGAANVAIMDVLSLDWMSIGALHYLIIVEKVTSFIWSRLFGHMSTSNSLIMLSDVIAEHGRPKLVVSDSGPSFRGEFVASLQALHIDHSSPFSYLAKTNGRAISAADKEDASVKSSKICKKSARTYISCE